LSTLKKLPEAVRRVGLIANPEKAACHAVIEQAVCLVTESGRKVLADEATSQLAGLKLVSNGKPAQLARKTDLLLVFGGDGTMLRVAREIAGSKTPILGINVGGLGFLTAVPSHRLGEALNGIWQGKFELESRPLIAATGMAQGQAISQLALNDFVLGRGSTSRMVELEVSVDGQVLTRYRCDGLVVSSPTGSTAYSLSAGGAVVCPSAEVFTLTPICPHTLSNRSVIVNLNSSVQVKVISHKLETVMTADGQVQVGLAAGDVVTIRRSSHSVRLVHLAGSSFFATLRQKLSWSGSSV
jgi:NAD+ kinase